jgi:hypothetical protein
MVFIIPKTLQGLKEDFAWIEIKCTTKNEYYLYTINYIDNIYTINHKNVDYKKVKKTLKSAIKTKNEVVLIKMK